MEILNTYTETIYSGGFSIVGMMLIVAAIAAFVFAFMLNESFSVTVINMIACFVFSMLAFFLFETANEVEETRYEVTIDKSVPFTEVMQDYELIERRGDIYVLKEREQDE